MASKTMATKRLFSGAFQIRSYSAPAERAIPPAKQKYVPTNGTYPKGFVAGSAFAGVKASNTKYDDLAIVASEKPAMATACFTKNMFQAAPVTLSKDLIYQNRESGMYGVVVNSGCANAVTGKEGLEDAKAMSSAASKLFGNGTDQQSHSMMVMSTGVIGQRLPIDKITSNIPNLKPNAGSTHEHWLAAARAICTTDTFPKLLSRNFTLPSQPNTTYSIAGMTKGAGMIHPNMATLLAIVATDVQVAGSMKAPLLRATKKSFNSITIDGDTSTNDSVALFANGAAAPADCSPMTFGAPNNQSNDANAFEKVLTDFMSDLAKLVVRDGEGATKFVTVRVQTDSTPAMEKHAGNVDPEKVVHRVAKSIATSSLVKTALYGKDANWGRILCAVGYTFEKPGVIEPTATSVSFVPADGSEELKLLVRGEPEQVDEVRAKEILEMEDLEILVRLNDRVKEEPKQTKQFLSKKEEGIKAAQKAVEDAQYTVEAVVWTCDLSHEYVTINGDYRT